MNVKLTATQTTILKAAASRAGGNIEPLPATLRGGARTKVIEGLLARELIACQNGQYFLADAGYAAVGRQHFILDAVTNRDATAIQKPRTLRPGTKQAAILALLQRPEGATGAQIGAATNWQAHSIRGFISGTVGKKLGLNVVSEKNGAGERAYRIA